jgi:hypothetical protein
MDQINKQMHQLIMTVFEIDRFLLAYRGPAAMASGNRCGQSVSCFSPAGSS